MRQQARGVEASSLSKLLAKQRRLSKLLPKQQDQHAKHSLLLLTKQRRLHRLVLAKQRSLHLLVLAKIRRLHRLMFAKKEQHPKQRSLSKLLAMQRRLSKLLAKQQTRQRRLSAAAVGLDDRAAEMQLEQAR